MPVNWTPFGEDELAKIIADALAFMDPPARHLWNLIRIRPVKWQLQSWGDPSGGFWVVAVMGHQVIWYNDIELGFNVSPFEVPGVIAKYWCNQDELFHTLNELYRQIESGEPGRFTSPVPIPDNPE